MALKDEAIFKDHTDYWMVADNIRDIYLSEGSLLTLLDFERVLDELDIYAFKNWEIGELVAGPEIGKYTVTVTFMWPEKMMPDPRGAVRLGEQGESDTVAAGGGGGGRVGVGVAAVAAAAVGRRVEAAPQVQQVVAHLGVDRVHHVGPVDRDDQHVFAMTLQLQRLVGRQGVHAVVPVIDDRVRAA